ncbi:glycosyltransferase family 4 protein [Aquabacterium sp. OR-4]|uniref:glycosyltransferase family 4 protein n=1 Tax=Aquabacterium sp. OR-4 TaxID=2978127 RepID=UPI0021B232FB|nr:glycosyltransferase family 1 protein [Aquabacterium sp. OR-4]MDT7836842.1 glycosyltransferase family 1 protein [Aquabacterium sp. OR-4]
MAELRHIGLCLGRLETWHDGLGEVSRRLGEYLAAQAPALREEGIALHVRLPQALHGCFGDGLHYIPTHTWQRLPHWGAQRFDLWHTIHQHIRLRAPIGTRQRLLTVHDLNFVYSKAPRKVPKYLRKLTRLCQRQTALVAITRHVADDMQRHLALGLGLAPQVIHNGVSDLSSAPREPLPDAPRPGYLLHLSRMAASKNVKALLELASAMPGQAFVFAGPRSVDSEQLRGEIQRRGLGHVQLIENVSEAQKAWLFAHCRGFLFPSLTEGFGLPPLEAMQFGKPVFLSRLTSLPEVGGAVAYYFDRFDGPAMRTVVQDGLADFDQPGRVDAVLAHARSFSWARCGQAYLALYRQLLAR